MRWHRTCESCQARCEQVVFPPLTYLQPTERTQFIQLDSNCFKVVEVVPHVS